MDIIMYLIQLIQYQHKQICWLINFICKYIPLKQWAFDDSHSPKYQKFKIDELPKNASSLKFSKFDSHVKPFFFTQFFHNSFDTINWILDVHNLQTNN